LTLSKYVYVTINGKQRPFFLHLELSGESGRGELVLVVEFFDASLRFRQLVRDVQSVKGIRRYVNTTKTGTMTIKQRVASPLYREYLCSQYFGLSQH